jgi:hypothetical protein
VGTTVAVAVGGRRVAEGVEVGSDDVGVGDADVVGDNALTGVGGTVTEAASVSAAGVGDADVVGYKALVWEQAASPHSTSTAPTMTRPVFLILLPSYIAA